MEYVISISLVAMVIFMIYFMVKARANFWLILFVIPWMLFTMGFGFMLYEISKGYATQLKIPNSQFLYAKVMGDVTYVMVLNEKGPRLHVLPSSEELRKEIKKGNRQVKEGKTVMIEGNDNIPVPRLHLFDHKKQMPK